MTANNNLNKDSPWLDNELTMITERKPANHKAYHIPWSREIIPTSRISLTSKLCTQGLFTPIVGTT